MMDRIKIFLAIVVLALGSTQVFRAGLGNDDTWFNGVSVAPIKLSASDVAVSTAIVVPPPPPGPTKEELEQKDLKEASDDFVDKGNKYYKKSEWGKAVAYYKKALTYSPENDEAHDKLKKAQNKIAAEKARLAAAEEEARRLYVEQRDTTIEQDRQNYNRQLQKLMVEADHITVPSPYSGHIREGFILGLFDTQEAADALARVPSPFTGKLYNKEEVFPSTDSQLAHEALRGLYDNKSIGEYSLNTEYGKRLVEKLTGAQFDRLMAHSNGATIAEALIKKGIIKVNELNVMGGDRSLINRFGYQNLIDSGKVKRVVVWINPGDVIPIGSSLQYVTPAGGVNVVPLLTSAEHAANQLTGTHRGGDAAVEYRLLKGPEYAGQTINLDKTIFEAHDLVRSYLPNIGSYFKSHSSN
jgi:tetratricopeptide (TPR) repeat protein